MQRTKGEKDGFPHNDEKIEYKMKEGLIILHNVWREGLIKNMGFPDVFNDYDEYWEPGIGEFHFKRAELIEDWLEPGSTMLDADVAQGSEYLMRKKNLKIVGFDISNAACEKARQRGIFAQVRDINNWLALNEEFYDYMRLSEVIEHTVYPQRILIDATHHARKGVIVTIPNAAYISYRIQLPKGYSPRQSFTHLHYWFVKDFELFCNTLNIRILDIKTMSPRSLMRFRNLLATTQAWSRKSGELIIRNRCNKFWNKKKIPKK